MGGRAELVVVAAVHPQRNRRQRRQSEDGVIRPIVVAVERPERAGGVGLVQRRADRADPGGACRTQPGAQQHRAVAAHRPADEAHPRDVQVHRRQHRDQLVEHHRARVLAAGPPMPVAVAAVDGDHRERRPARLDQIGEHLFDAETHHLLGVAAHAVQRDHRAQRPDLAGRPGDDPVGQHTRRGPPRRTSPTLGRHWARRPVSAAARRLGRDRRGWDGRCLGRIHQRAQRPDARCARDGTGTKAQRSTAGKLRHERHIADPQQRRPQSHAESESNMAVTFCQRNNCALGTKCEICNTVPHDRAE